ncbi:hypothetical protein [Merismopedia glauca]|uniref:DUF1190 domain-containing protein n=1 Tax=Merismopedia glauca CCAP 1448/3 TaxID=1296344 RepID=A0A2T1C4H1_9CYAN|nr:hypothetical protein [Merismopedia glauca]PSB03182.1 hypothetical protein C7B64_09535 [Merismopedia glauca CCAP 1448/3]
MLRKLTVFLMSVVLCVSTVACGGSEVRNNQNPNLDTTSRQTAIASGKYPVQQATYDDANGEYTLMLLNTPPGAPATYRSTNVRMARLTDEEVKEGEKTFLNVSNEGADLHLSEDFKIEYVHNVTETRDNPQTGQRETVVIRQQSSFWTPFAGALAGQLVGNLLFRPQYYVPPVYQPGVSVLQGYGGYGSSYNQAVQSYQTRYNAPPAAVRNRTTLRTSGRLRRQDNGQSSNTRRRVSGQGSRSSGSGFGSSNLESSGKSRTNRPSSSRSFGSGRSPSRSSGFGSRSRRR